MKVCMCLHVRVPLRPLPEPVACSINSSRRHTKQIRIKQAQNKYKLPITSAEKVQMYIQIEQTIFGVREGLKINNAKRVTEQEYRGKKKTRKG